MILLMLVAVDLGRVFFSYVAVSNAAREATNYAAAHAADTPWDASPTGRACADAATRETNVQAQGGAGALTVSDPTCYSLGTSTTIDCHTASNFAIGIGNQVQVTASQPFTFVTPLIGNLFGGSVMLSATATAPILNPLDVSILPGPTQAPTPTPSPASTASATPTPALRRPPARPDAHAHTRATATGSGPTPSPHAEPVPTPSPTPSPSPTPIATPVPMCTVPDFRKGYWNNTGGVPALTVWHDQASFTGTLTNLAGNNEIKTQTIHKGNLVVCTSNMSVND